MKKNILKLLAYLGGGASGLVGVPIVGLGSKDKDSEMLDSDSEEAKMMQAERQAMRDYEASPARQDRLSAMSEDEVDSDMMDQLEKDRQYKLEALKKLRGGY